MSSALPILRELSAQSGGSLLRDVRRGDTSMLKVWVGLEARRFVQASIEDVRHLFDVAWSSLLLPTDISRSSAALSTICYLQTYRFMTAVQLDPTRSLQMAMDVALNRITHIGSHRIPQSIKNRSSAKERGIFREFKRSGLVTEGGILL